MSFCDNEKYFEMINLDIDGELGEVQKRELHSHMAECEQCAELYKILSENKQACAELSQNVPTQLKTKVMDTIYPPKKGFLRVAITVATTAAALLFLVFGTAPFWLAMMPAGSAAPENNMGAEADRYDDVGATDADDGRVEFVLHSSSEYSVKEADGGLTVGGFEPESSPEGSEKPTGTAKNKAILYVKAVTEDAKQYVAELLQMQSADTFEVTPEQLETVMNDDGIYEKAELTLCFAENEQVSCVIKVIE